MKTLSAKRRISAFLLTLAGLVWGGDCAVVADDVMQQDVYLQGPSSRRVRFDQTIALGNPAQAWDLIGNLVDVSTNRNTLAITDVNTGRTPFSGFESGGGGTPLYVTSDGRVGITTTQPGGLLEVFRQSQQVTAETVVRFSLSGDFFDSYGLEINNASTSEGVFVPRIQGRPRSAEEGLIFEGLITTDAGVAPAVAFNAAKLSGGGLATRPLVAYRNNNVVKVTFAANGDVTATSFNPVSSRSLKDRISSLKSAVAAEALRHMTPVTFIYNDDATNQQRVGFIAEDVPEIIANEDRKSVPLMDTVAVVTRVVKDQLQSLDDQEKAIDSQKRSTTSQQTLIDKQVREVELSAKDIAEETAAMSEHSAELEKTLKRLMALEARFSNQN